jgi:hypothetical protein
MDRPTVNLIISIIFICLSILGGCKSESVNPPDDNSLSGEYGQGTIFFNADETTGYFYATGKYKPSDQFSQDTASQGAGGFIKDTTLFNKKIQMLFTGYIQKQDSNNLKQYLLVFGLYDSLTTPRTGVYHFAKNNIGWESKNVYAYFVRTDSIHFYETLVPKSGILTMNLFEQDKRHVRGTFSGILWGLPPDTLTTLNLTNGIFDLFLVDHFFNY